MASQLQTTSHQHTVTVTLTQEDPPALSFYAEPVQLKPDSYSYSASVDKTIIPIGFQSLFEEGVLGLFQYIQVDPENHLAFEEQSMQDEENPKHIFVVKVMLITKKVKRIQIESFRQVMSKQKRLEIQLQALQKQHNAQSAKFEKLKSINKELQSLTSTHLQTNSQLQAQIKSQQNQYLTNLRRLQEEKACLKTKVVHLQQVITELKGQLQQSRSRPIKKVHLDKDEEKSCTRDDLKASKERSESSSKNSSQINLGEFRKQEQKQTKNGLWEDEPQYVDFQPIQTVQNVVKAVERQKAPEKNQGEKLNLNQNRFSPSFLDTLQKFVHKYCTVKMSHAQQNQKKVYQCFVCKKAFLQIKYLMSHFSVKHYQNIDENWTEQDLKAEQKKYKNSNGYDYKVKRNNTNSSSFSKKSALLEGFFSKYANP